MADPVTSGILKSGRAMAPPLTRPSTAGSGSNYALPPTLSGNGRPNPAAMMPTAARRSDLVVDRRGPNVAQVKPQPALGALGEAVTNQGLYPYWQKLGRHVPAMIRREAWAKYPIDPTELQSAPAGGYHQITLHHTGDERTPQEVEALHRAHEPPLHAFERDAWVMATSGRLAQRYRSWGDVGYNFLIGVDGTIYEGRALKYQGAHVEGHNPGNIGIAFLGDYGKAPLSTAQIRSAGALVGQLSHIYGIGPDQVFTHARWDAKRHSELQGPSRAGQIDAIRRVARKP